MVRHVLPINKDSTAELDEAIGSNFQLRVVPRLGADDRLLVGRRLGWYGGTITLGRRVSEGQSTIISSSRSG